MLAAYLLQGYLDAIRTRMLARIAGLFDAALQEPITLELSSISRSEARLSLGTPADA